MDPLSVTFQMTYLWFWGRRKLHVSVELLRYLRCWPYANIGWLSGHHIYIYVCVFFQLAMIYIYIYIEPINVDSNYWSDVVSLCHIEGGVLQVGPVSWFLCAENESKGHQGPIFNLTSLSWRCISCFCGWVAGVGEIHRLRSTCTMCPRAEAG